MDSHNCDRHVVNGMVKNEGNVEIGGFPPYPISYRAITPKRKEVRNLLVPVCLSTSHIAYGSIRMEPVFMVLGQSAAIAACQAIDRHDNCVQDVDAGDVRKEFENNPLADNSQPEILIDNHDTLHVQCSGYWKTEIWKAYGPDFFSDASKGTSDKSIRYTPDIPADNSYEIYAYFPKVSNAATQTLIDVYDGNELHRMAVRSSDIVVEGQTSGEWAFIGRYRLAKGTDNYVRISNEGADGVVVADAVLFIPVTDK